MDLFIEGQAYSSFQEILERHRTVPLVSTPDSNLSSIFLVNPCDRKSEIFAKAVGNTVGVGGGSSFFTGRTEATKKQAGYFSLDYVQERVEAQQASQATHTDTQASPDRRQLAESTDVRQSGASPELRQSAASPELRQSQQ